MSDPLSAAIGRNDVAVVQVVGPDDEWILERLARTLGAKFRPPDIAPKSPCFLEVSPPQFEENCERFF